MILAVVMSVTTMPIGVFASATSELTDGISAENNTVVSDNSSLTTDIEEKVFVVGETNEFSFTTMANKNAGTYVRGLFKFSNFSAVERLEYKESQDGDWYEFTENFGSESGFPLTDNSVIYFRASFNKAGTYSLTVYLNEAVNGETLCSKTVNVTVKNRSEIRFENESIEIKYGDTNVTNDTLENSVSGAEFTYKSNDESIVKVDEYGFLTPVSVGKTVITVTRAETNEYVASSASYTVNVVKGIQDELTWQKSIPDSIVWNDENGFSNTVTGGSGDGNITYSSDDTDVAEVDPSNGDLTIKKPGVVNITAVKDGKTLYENKTASYSLNVIKAEQAEIYFEELNPDAIYFGDTYKNTAKGGSVNGEFEYESSDTTVAEVDSEGNVTALKSGTVTITATLDGDEYYEAAKSVSYNLVIYRASQKTALVFSKGTENQIIQYGINDYANVVTGGNTAPVTYSSSNEEIAKADPKTGVITPLKAGTVTITATAPQTEQYEAQSLSYELTIETAEQNVVFEHGTTDIPAIAYGDSYQNEANAETDIVYTSSDTEIADVDEKGKLTVFKAGTVTITAAAEGTEQYSKASASYTITINKAEQTVTFDRGKEPEVTFNDNGKAFINTAVTNATEKGEIGISAFYSIVGGEEFTENFDSETGSFTVVGAGTIIVEVSFGENDRYKSTSDSYTLVVAKADQTIAFEKSDYSMTNGDKYFESPSVSDTGAGTGLITYSISNNQDSVVSAIDSNTGKLAFTGYTGTVTVLATKASDDNYNAAYAEYTLAVSYWTYKENHYSISGDTINDSGWYSGNVSIVADDGYKVSYSCIYNDADWQDCLADAVTADGTHDVSFYVKDESNGFISQKMTVTVEKDETVPTAVIKTENLTNWENFLTIITLGIWKPESIQFTIDSNDVTSKVSDVEYYIDYIENEEELVVKSEEELASIEKWQDYDSTKKISVENGKTFVVYAKVTDNAGNYVYASTNGIVFDKTAVPTENIDIEILTDDFSGFYNSDVEIKVSVSDALPSSGINTVKYEVVCDGNTTQSEILYTFENDNPEYTDLVSSWNTEDAEKNITVSSSLNNSDNVTVKVTVVDNAGNTNTKEQPLKICTNKPTLDVSYVNDPAIINTYNGVNYYDTERTAKVVITGRTSVFNKSDKPQIVVNESKENTYEIVSWVTKAGDTPDTATHTLLIKFNGSAGYDFSVNYTDIFGTNLEYTSDKFVADLDTPTGSVTIDTTNTWRDLLETITFGLWKNDEVEITVSASDDTSPIKSIEYYKSNSESILISSELDKLSDEDWTEYEKAFSIDADEQFSIYLKVTDYAERVKYVCSDGYIVDMTQSNIVITPDAPNENGIYSSDFNVRLDVEDAEPYSGIKSVEYWVTNNGEETQRGSLYSFEYTRDAGENSNGGTLKIYEDGKIIKDETGVTPKQTDLKSYFSKVITIDAEANNSDYISVFVKVVDNAGNETIEKIENLSINVNKPEIYVEYDVNSANIVDGRGYFKTNRTAKIVITERTSSFNGQIAADSIVFSGVDSNGNPVEFNREEMISEWVTQENGNDPNAATHTAYVYFDTDANYDFTISYKNEAGHECTYEDVKFAEGTEAKQYFTIDKAAPSGTVSVGENTWIMLLKVLTFGLYDSKSVKVTATANDITSPITVEYYKSSDIVIKDAELLDAVTEWQPYSGFNITADEKFVVYLKITDYAGNVTYISSDGYIVDMTESYITLTPENTDLSHNGIPLYNKDVNVLIDVKEKNDESYSGINKVEYWVKCGGKETQRETLYSYEYTRDVGINSNGGTLEVYENGMLTVDKDGQTPLYAELKSEFSKTVIIDSAKNNSCDVVLYVGVTDNAGNYAEENVAVDIDVTAPTISVSYDNDSPYKINGEKGYFPAGRTATVTIKERTAHFDASKATAGIKITAVDAKGKNVIDDCSALISSWNTTGIGNSAVHTGVIDFSKDANYTFEISYADLAANSNETVDTKNSVTPYNFAVDKTAPAGTVTAGKLGSWDKLIQILTFGLWTKDTVNITGTAYDVTSNIESVSYYKTSNTVAVGKDKLEKITEWKPFNGFNVSADEKFVVYIRIVDYAGNTTYISTNGIIADDTAPAVESVKPEITITPQQPVNGIYNTDVTVAVDVVDPKIGDSEAYSGLKEIRYEVYNMDVKTQEGILYSFDTDNPVHSELVQTWHKADAITVNKELNNSNDVDIKVYAVDNAGNASEASQLIQIDTTAPTIKVTYDNNAGDSSFTEGVYFNENRAATIVVTERNFDPAAVKTVITNTDGYVPEITGWTTVQASGNGDGTTHTAYVVFDRDGDYTFDISCDDKVGNANVAVDYGSSLAPQKFTVDKTLPEVSVSYDNNNVLNDNYYRDQRTATITVKEHNFETSRIRIYLDAENKGVQADLPAVSSWHSNGDVHTATITFDDDALYSFDFDYQDKSGNASSDIAEQTFYVDKTNPEVSITGIVDESANNDSGNIGFVITATDINFDIFVPELTVTDITGKATELNIGTISDIENGKVFTVENIEADGIYRIACTVVDKAGNAFLHVTLQNADGSYYVEELTKEDYIVSFSVNRDGSTYEISGNTASLVSKYYVQNVTDDIVIIETNADPLKEYNVTLNGKVLTKDTDYTVTEEGGNGNWMKYTYTVNKELFDAESEYVLVVSSTDKADNDAFSDVKDSTVSFVVDRTAPIVTVSGLENDGRYQTNSQKVTLIPTDDGGALNSLIVRTVDEDGNEINEIVSLSGEALEKALEEGAGKIEFEIGEGLYQNIQIICTDCAGDSDSSTNTYNVIFTDVSVSSNAFMIFWANRPLRFGTIISLAVLIVSIILFIILKKRKNNDNKINTN